MSTHFSVDGFLYLTQVNTYCLTPVLLLISLLRLQLFHTNRPALCACSSVSSNS